MVKRTFIVEGMKYRGQDLDGWRTEHMGTALNGMPIRRAVLESDERQVIEEGQYLIAFESGQQMVLTAKAWQSGKGKDETEPVSVPSALQEEPELTKEWRPGQPVRLAPSWPRVPFDNEIKEEHGIRFRWDRIQGDWIKLPPVPPEPNAKRRHPITKRAQTYQPSTGWLDDDPVED